VAEETVLARGRTGWWLPDGYDGGAAVPFVVLLHGLHANGQGQDTYFRMSELAQARTFILATPDGLIDTKRPALLERDRLLLRAAPARRRPTTSRTSPRS